jgi:N-methylhydantoinase B
MRAGAFTLEVFRNQVSAVAEEMGAALHHSAYSPNIKERKDHSCAVFDPEGKLAAQAEHIPVHLGAMPETVRAVLDRFNLKPGDVAVLNDPYSGGTHLPDISMVSPAFKGRRLVGFLASRAHHSDVGGLAPGSLALSSDIFQEGLILPPVLIRRHGDPEQGVVDLICRNSRTPEERSGDIAAQIGAHSVGEHRLLALAERLGTGALIRGYSDLMDYSEELTRLAISRIPRGDYAFTDHLDNDGFSDEPVPVKVKVSVKSGSVLVDFTGTSPAVEGPFNCPLSVTLSATYYVFRCITGGDIPANDGAFRPIEVFVPEGCLVAAKRPRPVCGGNIETSQRIVDALLGALSDALPELMPAASYGTMSNLSIGRASGPYPFSYYETIAGGAGGGPAFAGASATQAHMTNTLNTPIEALECSYPLRVLHYRIRRGSGGSGAHRGGDGLDRALEVLEDCTVTVMGDRRKTGPWGLSGGAPGKQGRDYLISEGNRRKLSSKITFSVNSGDVIRILTPGGGGWGGHLA